MNKNQIIDQLKPYKSLIVVRIVLDYFKISPIFIGFLSIFGYWGLTLLAYSLGSDFYINVEYHDIPVPNLFKLQFNLFEQQDVAKTFFEDKSHFAFSFLAIFPAAIVGTLFLKKLKVELLQFIQNDTLNVTDLELNNFITILQRKYNSWLPHIFGGIIGILSLVVFLNFSFSDKYIMWWGHVNNSLGGILLALIEAVVMYHFICVGYIGYITVKAINKLMDYPVILHQFHSDNCNGFKPLGNIILYLYALSLVMAIAVFIVLYLGFLGLQNTILVWILVVFCLFLIPLYIFMPTYSVWSKLSFERKKKIQTIEKRLYRIISKMEQNIDEDGKDSDLKVSIEDLLKIKESFHIYDDINVWPYNARIIQTITATYLLQAVLILYEFIINN